jgi:radical SAM protein with 4Fe4S-binding SPASM domain
LTDMVEAEGVLRSHLKRIPGLRRLVLGVRQVSLAAALSPWGRHMRLHHLITNGLGIRAACAAPVSLRRKLNFVLCRLSARLGLSFSLGRPIQITVEPTNVCNLRCPLCETGNGSLGRRNSVMGLEEFCALLDRFDSTLEQVFLYFMGESFLNKDIYTMIRAATDRGIWVNLCTNGNKIDPQRLVESGVGEINFQIGGMTQETHAVYRVGGNLAAALQALEKTIALRNAPDSPNKAMRINVGFIAQRHNEHEIPLFQAYCRRVGVDQANVIATALRKASDWEAWMPQDPDLQMYDPVAQAEGRLTLKERFQGDCGWIYSTMTIQVNGDAVPCCHDPKGKHFLGNVFQTSPYKIWNSRAYRNMRRQVSSQRLDLCASCAGYDVPPLGIAEKQGVRPCSQRSSCKY